MVTTTFSDSDLSLYIHLPFCNKKCPYCSFYVIPYKESVADSYIESLKAEWALYKDSLKNRSLISLYFGGGTPSLHPQGIIEMIDLLKETFCLEKTEITVEVNPEDGSQALFDQLKGGGANRLSFGAQTLSNPLLTQIGRMHSTETTLSSIQTAQKCGFSNISIDLMTEIPGQILSDVESTLAQIERLNITHVSLYNLQIEKGTPFYKNKEAILKQTVDSKTAAKMITTCAESLKSIGFIRYEISAFCKEGFESKHNTGYWFGREFLGLGASSFSYMNKTRFQNIAHINKYKKLIEQGEKPINFTETLSGTASLLELLALHLRLMQGFSLTSFETQHGNLPKKTHGELEKLIDEGLLKQEGEKLSLSSKGSLFFDDIAPRIIA